MSWLSGDLHTHCLSPTRRLHYFKLQISQSGVRAASHSCVCWAAELWVSREMFLAIYREMSNIFVSHRNTMIHTINKTNKQKTPSQLLLSRAEGLGFVVNTSWEHWCLVLSLLLRPELRQLFMKTTIPPRCTFPETNASPPPPAPGRVTCSSFPLWNRTVKQHKVTSFSSGQCQRTQGLLSL